jgi:hypothetical protein
MSQWNHGIEYVYQWVIDDIPTPLKTKFGDMISVPREFGQPRALTSRGAASPQRHRVMNGSQITDWYLSQRKTA